MLMIRHPNRSRDSRCRLAPFLAWLSTLPKNTTAAAIAKIIADRAIPPVSNATDLDAGIYPGGQPGRAFARKRGGA